MYQSTCHKYSCLASLNLGDEGKTSHFHRFHLRWNPREAWKRATKIFYSYWARKAFRLTCSTNISHNSSLILDSGWRENNQKEQDQPKKPMVRVHWERGNYFRKYCAVANHKNILMQLLFRQPKDSLLHGTFTGLQFTRFRMKISHENKYNRRFDIEGPFIYIPKGHVLEPIYSNGRAPVRLLLLFKINEKVVRRNQESSMNTTNEYFKQ